MYIYICIYLCLWGGGGVAAESFVFKVQPEALRISGLRPQMQLLSCLSSAACAMLGPPLLHPSSPLQARPSRPEAHLDSDPIGAIAHDGCNDLSNKSSG